MPLRGPGLDFEGSWNRFDASKLEFSRFCGINVSLEKSFKNVGPWCLRMRLWMSLERSWWSMGSTLEVLDPIVEAPGIDIGGPEVSFGGPGIQLDSIVESWARFGMS